MQFQKKEKRQTTVRFDSHHVRLRTGEVQRKTGSYMYRWTDMSYLCADFSCVWKKGSSYYVTSNRRDYIY